VNLVTRARRTPQRDKTAIDPTRERTAVIEDPNHVEDVVIGAMRLGTAIQSHLATFFQSYGVTQLQFNLLRILYVNDLQQLGMPTGSFAARLVTRVPDVSRLVDRLVKAGFIERIRSTTDRRVVRVRLTVDGLELVEAIHEPLLEHNRKLLGYMSERKLINLGAGLKHALRGLMSISDGE